MPKAKSAAVQSEEMRQKFIQRCGELWDEHTTGFMKVCMDSEKKQIRVAFAAQIDLSESTAKLTTGLSYSESHTDSREDDFDNPDFVKKNPALPGVDMDKARGKKAAAKDE